MRICRVLSVFFLAGSICPAFGLFTGEPLEEGPWSKEFRQDISEIDRTTGQNEEAGLLSMLDKYKKPYEQAEIHYQLAILYNQLEGMIDHSKAVEHFAKVQEFDIPPPARAMSHVLCGDSFRIRKDYQEALSQYLHGLSGCLKYDLPDTPPELPSIGRYRVSGPPDDPSVKAIHEKREKQLAARKRAMFERDMIKHRDVLERQLATLYDRVPFEEAAFRRSAAAILKDARDVENLVTSIIRHLEEEKP